jgi:8-oxo-dGTP pyrophosphatase MutT (NUDIX family)
LNEEEMEAKKQILCNNCGKLGHISYHCSIPITSHGIIAYRNRKIRNANGTGNCETVREYLMIRRKDTLGYIDFIRGKYSLYKRQYILNMFHQMTVEERRRISRYVREYMLSDSGFLLWKSLWEDHPPVIQSPPGLQRLATASAPAPASAQTSTTTPMQNVQKHTGYKNLEERNSKEKLALLAGVNLYGGPQQPSGTGHHGQKKPRVTFTLNQLLEECDKNPAWQWETPEWGFPKGRRDAMETDWKCATREFTEETGIPAEYICPVGNLLPFEENFIGSNFKPYKHKYFVVQIDEELSDIYSDFCSSEVSRIAWMSFDECMGIIRPYNYEKKQMLMRIHATLDSFFVCKYSQSNSFECNSGNIVKSPPGIPTYQSSNSLVSI